MNASDLGLNGPVGSVVTVGGPTGALDLSVITGTGGIVISIGQEFINVDGSSITGGGGSGSVTSTSVVSANGFAGTVANPTTTPAITITTTATGVLKGNGTAIAAATAGTDYQAPITLTTTGSSGAATFSGGTLNVPQYPNGSVTAVSVATANGFAGTVANPTTTPAITITTAATGLLKGTGTAIAAATAGTDYQAPITLTTTGSSGAATFSGNSLNIPQYSGGGGGSGTVNSGAAGQIAVFPSGGTAVSGTSAPVIPTVVAIYASTTNFDLSQSNNQQVTLTGNPTLTLSNATAGQRFTINLVQDGTGSRTVTWFGGITWAGGSAPTLQTAAAAIDTISFWCVSTGVYQGYPTSLPVPGALGQIPHNNGTTLVGSANALISSNSLFNIGSAVSDPGTFVAGDLWPSSTSGGPKYARAAGLGGAMPQCIFSCGACTAVTATSPTSLLQSPTGPEGSLTIPANTLKAGNVLRWDLWGQWSATGGGQTAGFQVILGGSVVHDVFTATAAMSIAHTNAPWYWTVGTIPILSIGSSATAGGYSAPSLINPGGGGSSAQSIPGGVGSPAASAIFNSTTSVLFDMKMLWSGSGNSIQVLSFRLYIDN